ncbi:transmembrane anterior posterior transformation protein 1 homolog [Pseudophryne corroboree]|uniref:transmembrane anterior posterior transformation protein 1 homolog n=1 Tax=Pseudophryne corroboree TaxID=495146 RepID=UPI0030818C97
MADAAAALSGEDKEEDGGDRATTARPAETLGFYEMSDGKRVEVKKRNLSDLSLFRFIGAELTRGYFLEHNEAKYKERRERVYTCLRIPRELEKLMIFGFFLCLDAFLYVFTLLPLRVLLAFIRFITLPCCGLRLLCSNHTVQCILNQHDGFLHAILILVQATTLNVAFNSHNKSLLTIMMSNNFVEIKGSVFKKFEKNNLFQMSNSDIKERFTNYVLLLIVCLRNMEQFSWNPDHLWVLFPDVCMVIASEIVVDVIKHAFITKFNDITADVYSEYRASLAFELVSSRQKNAYTDYSDSVSRRMGFIPLPLAVLLIRVVTSSVKVQGVLAYACVVLFYFGLITLKVLNSIILLGKSCQYVKEAKMEEKLFQPPATSAPGKTPKKAPSKSKAKQGPPADAPVSASVTSQPKRQNSTAPLLVESNPDKFLTTPDGEEKDITQDNADLKNKSANKDLLDIDRFTICGNRID